MVLKFLVKYQTLYLLSRDPVIADSSGYLQANFIFSDDWEGTNKTAQFKRTESTLITDGTPLFFNEEIDSNGNCIIPWEVLKGEGTFNVNVFGQKTESDGTTVKTITVNSLDIRVGQSGLTTNEIPQDSTPNQYDNIYEEIQKAGKKTQASQTAAAASQAAAKTSETNAKTSETNAASSATASASSASAAKTSENNAASSKSAAATSATNAANSAKAAAASATAAANSAREKQADWAVTDSTSRAFIKNKPDVLLKSGGTLTGNNAKITMSNGESFITSYGNGLYLGGTDDGSGKGSTVVLFTNTIGDGFQLNAGDGTTQHRMAGKPDGTLTWDSKEIDCVSAKGTYGIRFESGIQICWGELTIPAGTSGREVSGTMTFPYPFANTNYVVTFGNDWLASSSEYYRAEGRNKENFKFTAVDVNSNPQKAFYIAIGYWK